MKICKNDALKVIDLYCDGKAIKEISKICNVHKSTIFRILKGQRKIDSRTIDLIKEKRKDFQFSGQKLTKKDIEGIKKLKSEGMKPAEIAKLYNCCESTISRSYRK